MESVASISSGSSSMPPSLLPAGEYEVFLSFRGLDVRNTFADHLYTSLSRSKIRTFRDNEELRKGGEISPGLVRAIGESKIYIPILTEHYASSKWCLQELAQMVECCKQGKGHLFLPIFYFVDPRDVRHQQGPYKQAFEQHSQKHNLQTVEEWKEALQVVGKMKGWHVTQSDGQGAVIDQVVSEAEFHLRSMYTLVTDELVGIDTHVEGVMQLLNLDSDNSKVIGIHGMGGIGKTTLSKAVYNKISAQFDRCCFVENVRETLARSDGVVSLQNRLISSILRHDGQVKNGSEGIKVIKERVCKFKALFVFDDIDDKFEFDLVLGKLRDFSLKSRFIFTTRDKRVLDFLIGCQVYEVSEMSPLYSFQLFSKHAFGMDHPPEGYATLTEEFVKVAAGLPLALKVFGSLVFRRERKFWEEKLIELQGIPSTENKVLERLKISYKELTHNEKQIFLDIACLFIGIDKDLPYYMWSACNFQPESGINTLILRSLIKLDEENKFWMHDHVKDLGRAIVKEEDVRHSYKHSRIWSEEDALDMLRNKEGNDQVEVLRVEMQWKHGVFSDKEFKKLSGLRCLEVCHERVTRSFSEILPNIRMLRLYECKLISTDFNMKRLAVLDLEGCDVKDDWKGWKAIQAAHKLKVINLRCCTKLERAPDLSPCASLELINVENCFLMKGALHIGNFKNLKTLKLAGTKITELAGDIQMLQHLEEIDARFTDLTELPVGIDKLSSLKILNLASESITRLHTMEVRDRTGNLSALEILNSAYERTTIPHRMEVRRLPTSLRRLAISSRGGISNLLELKDLEYLSFFYSHQPQIPGDIRKLPNLKKLSLWSSPCDGLLVLETKETTSAAAVAALPSSLTCLDIHYCRPLTRLPSLSNLNRLTVLNLGQIGVVEIHGLGGLSSLQEMKITEAPNLNKLDGLGELRVLKTMKIIDAPSLDKLDGLDNLLLLAHLKVGSCGMLKRMPSLAKLIKLQGLEIISCGQLKDEVTGLERLVSLESLDMEGCTSIRKLPPDLSELKKLRRLNVTGCTSLMDTTGIRRLESLNELRMYDCSSIKELPNLSSLQKLVELNIGGCTELIEVPGIERLEKLKILSMSGCSSIKELPDLSALKNLEHLDITGCTGLIEVTGIERLEMLRTLSMSDCTSIKKLGDLSGLKNLEILDVTQCIELTEVTGIEKLQSLEGLQMSGCRSIKGLGDLSGLQNLVYFDIRGCTQITQLTGLAELESLQYLKMEERLKTKYSLQLTTIYGKRLVNRFVRSSLFKLSIFFFFLFVSMFWLSYLEFPSSWLELML